MYLPKDTLEALDHACQDLPFTFNRSELADMAIRQGLPKILARFGKIPQLPKKEQPIEVPAA